MSLSSLGPRSRTTSLILCALFAALIAVGAFLRIPIPTVPFTLQWLFVLLAGLILGPRWGMASVGLYLFMGLVGLPIFAEGGGIGYVLKPSFGYLIGFLLAAGVVGILARKPQSMSLTRLVCAALAGLGVVYLCGLVYFALISDLVLGTPIVLWPLLLYGLILAIPGDIALCLIAALVVKKLPFATGENRS